MSTIDPRAPSAPVPPAPKPNPFQRIIGVFISPGETFASIARKPDWVIPVLIIVVISLVSGVLIAQRVDFTALAREAMEMNPQAASMPADRMETSVRFTAGMMKVSTYLSPFLSVIVLLIVSAVLQLVVRLFGGEGSFLQAFSTTTYAWYPRVVKGVLATVVILSRSSLSIFDLQNPLMSNLGFLFDPKTQPLQFALASSLDIFAIWSVILLIIGFSEVSRLSRAKSAVIVIGLWLVVNLLALIGPAMQTLRK